MRRIGFSQYGTCKFVINVSCVDERWFLYKILWPKILSVVVQFASVVSEIIV